MTEEDQRTVRMYNAKHQRIERGLTQLRFLNHVIQIEVSEDPAENQTLVRDLDQDGLIVFGPVPTTAENVERALSATRLKRLEERGDEELPHVLRRQAD